MTAWARRQAGRRDPHRIIPVRRRSAYAGGGWPHEAANDNPAPARRHRLKTGWIVAFTVAAAAALALAFV